MPRTKDHFIKVELRLMHDPRFLVLSEVDRYRFIGLILLAKQTDNRIPKNFLLIKTFLRTECDASEIEATIECIKQQFPKFRSTKHYYYFKDFPERYTKVHERYTKSTGGDSYRGKEEEEEEEDPLTPLKGGTPPKAADRKTRKAIRELQDHIAGLKGEGANRRAIELAEERLATLKGEPK